MESLGNKVTIITGAGSGFGRATANFFAKYGAKLVIVDLNLEGAEETMQQCKSLGLTDADVITVKADISSEEDRKSIINECIVKFGRIDVLVNNAGIFRAKKITETSSELYDLLMDVNLKAQIFLANLAIPYLKQTKGNIVNLSSIVAHEPVVGCGAYAISKAAVDMFNKVLSLEMAEFGVRVNSVRPGTMITGLYDVDFGSNVKVDAGAGGLLVPEGITSSVASTSERLEQTLPEHPLGRLGTPQDIAHAVAFLASDMSAYSTGNSFFVDGGRHCIGARHNPHIQALKQQ